MKYIVFIVPFLLLIACKGSNNTDVENQLTSTKDTVFAQDHEWIVSAIQLKEKLSGLQKSFLDIGNKEVEETICKDDATVPYNGNKEELNLWLMTTYMLDNFSDTAFGKNNFNMPDVKIKGVTPLSEIDWLNINSLDSGMFDIYREYPDLKNVPKIITNDRGEEISYESTVEKTYKLSQAIEEGMFAVLAITDYVPPIYKSDTDYETGYLMGYVMFADWDLAELSCITPFLSQNKADFDFSGIKADPASLMKDDLHQQTFMVLDSIVLVRTGFTGTVNVNSKSVLERY